MARHPAASARARDCVDVGLVRQLDTEVVERGQLGDRRWGEGVLVGEELGEDEQERVLAVVGVAEPCAVTVVVLAAIEKFERCELGEPRDRCIDVGDPQGDVGPARRRRSFGRAVASLIGPPLRDARRLAALDPQDKRIAPRILERGIETVELRPVVVAPQLGRTARDGLVEDALDRIVVADQNPHPGGAAVLRELAGLDAVGVWVRAGIALRCRCPCAGCRSAPACRRRPGSSVRGRCDGRRSAAAVRPPSRTRQRRTRPTRRGRTRGSRRR